MSFLMIFQCCDTLLLKGIVSAGLGVEGPFIQQVEYNKTFRVLRLRWDPRSNIAKYNIRLFTCGDSMLLAAPVSASCSVSQLSGVNFPEYGLLLVEVQSCETDDKCGTNNPAKNIVALNFNNPGNDNNPYLSRAIYFHDIIFSCIFWVTTVQDRIQGSGFS